MDKTEQNVAHTVLQEGEKIKIGDKEYSVPPPTPATLISISELAGKLPEISLRPSNVITEMIAKAKDMSVLGDIAATLVLGAKRIREKRMVTVSDKETVRSWSWRRFGWVETQKEIRHEITEYAQLRDMVLYELTNEELTKLVAKMLGMLQISDFFVLTTSLSVVNIIKRTKEVGTASGDR